jgi:hypothetical protein
MEFLYGNNAEVLEFGLRFICVFGSLKDDFGPYSALSTNVVNILPIFISCPLFMYNMPWQGQQFPSTPQT